MVITLEDVKAARQRITPYIRHTPLVAARPLKQSIADVDQLWLKLECLQVTGSFKARGATNAIKALSPTALERGVITASGSNHGLAVAYGGWMAQVPTTIYLGHNTPVSKAHKLEQWGATVQFEGAVWDDANRAAIATAEEQNLTYIHPFADTRVIAGQGTLGLEILEELFHVDTLLVAIGGGGLISGVSFTAKTLKPNIKVIGVEPVGAATLKTSLEANQIIELETVDTQANTLAPRKTEVVNFNLIRQHVDQVVLVADTEMVDACQWLWFEMGVAAELSGAAPIAALMTRQYVPEPGETVCAIICGAGNHGLS